MAGIVGNARGFVGGEGKDDERARRRNFSGPFGDGEVNGLIDADGLVDKGVGEQPECQLVKSRRGQFLDIGELDDGGELVRLGCIEFPLVAGLRGGIVGISGADWADVDGVAVGGLELDDRADLGLERVKPEVHDDFGIVAGHVADARFGGALAGEDGGAR